MTSSVSLNIFQDSRGGEWVEIKKELYGKGPALIDHEAVKEMDGRPRPSNLSNSTDPCHLINIPHSHGNSLTLPTDPSLPHPLYRGN